MLLCLTICLQSCASVPAPSVVTRTQTVTVVQDRYIPVDATLVAAEPTPSWPAPPAVITNRVLDAHDAAATQALARANGKLSALRCAGIAGVDGTTALSCAPYLNPKE